MAAFTLPFKRKLWLAAALLFAALAQCVNAADNLTILRRTVVEADVTLPTSGPGHRLHLSLAVMRGAGWKIDSVLDSARRAAGLLAQCGIAPVSIELVEFDGPARYRTLYTPVSRQLAAELGLPKPALFFVSATRHRPAFDAEAVGRSNSRTRPEMADTVWIVKGARDLHLVIAHELVHVLADSGDHSEEDGNLMREDTAPGNTQLTSAQCERIAGTASRNGLLRPRP